jgi:hypothetical protein
VRCERLAVLDMHSRGSSIFAAQNSLLDLSHDDTSSVVAVSCEVSSMGQIPTAPSVIANLFDRLGMLAFHQAVP